MTLTLGSLRRLDSALSDARRASRVRALLAIGAHAPDSESVYAVRSRSQTKQEHVALDNCCSLDERPLVMAVLANADLTLRTLVQ